MGEQRSAERIYYLDVLRVLSAFAVVVLHVSSNNWYGFVGSANWTVFTVYAGFARFSVPIFFMISGALFLNSGKKVHTKRLFCQHILRLLIDLIVWSFIYQLYQLVLRGAGGTETVTAIFSHAVKNIIKGETQVHFWFLYTMIGIYLVLPILKVFTDHAEKRHLEYFLFLWFLTQSVCSAIAQLPEVQFVAVNVAKLGIQMTGGYVGYFVLGHYLHQYRGGGKRKAVYLFGVAGCIASISITWLVCVKQNSYNETYFGYFFPGIVLWSIAVFVFIQAHADKWKMGSSMVELVSNCSFGIYAVHMLFVFLLWDHGISTFSFPAILSVPILSLGVFACSFAVTFLLLKVPIIRKLL